MKFIELSGEVTDGCNFGVIDQTFLGDEENLLESKFCLAQPEPCNIVELCQRLDLESISLLVRGHLVSLRG